MGLALVDLIVIGLYMEFSLEKNGKGEKYGQENNALCRYRVIEISRIDRAE